MPVERKSARVRDSESLWKPKGVHTEEHLLQVCKEQKVSFCRHTAPLTSEIFLQWMQNVALTRKTIHMAVENRRKKLQSARRGAGGSGGLEGIIFLHIPDLTPLLFSLTLRLSFAFMSVCDPLPPHTHFNLRLYWGPGVSWTN